MPMVNKIDRVVMWSCVMSCVKLNEWYIHLQETYERQTRKGDEVTRQIEKNLSPFS